MCAMEKVSPHKIVQNRRMASHQAIYAVVSTYWEVSSRNRVCKQKMCRALWWTDILFSQRVIKFILGENGWIHGPVRGIFWKALYGAHVGCGKMSRMPLYARTFPHSAELVGFVQAVNGRHWVGIGMEGKRYLACGCGRGRMGTGADYLLNDIPFQESSSRMIDFYS